MRFFFWLFCGVLVSKSASRSLLAALSIAILIILLGYPRADRFLVSMSDASR